MYRILVAEVFVDFKRPNEQQHIAGIWERKSTVVVALITTQTNLQHSILRSTASSIGSTRVYKSF